jgi:hypothetical protein
MSAAKSGANSDITSLTGLTTPLSVAQGGTGAATLTANNVLLGNGTSAVAFVAPGTTGNILTSNGTTWSSSAPSGGGFRTRQLTAGTTYTPQSKVKSFYVFVYGSTGGRGGSSVQAGGMGGPGYSEKYYTSPSGSYTYAIGAGGTTAGTTGGTTSFDVVSVPGTIGLNSTSTTGKAGAAGSGGDFNATGGTGGNGNAGAGGGGGGAATRAGNGGNGGNAVTTVLAGGGGGTGGNNASGATGGAAATVKAAGALNLSTTLSTMNESWSAGNTASANTGARGANASSTQDITYIWTSGNNSSLTGSSATATGEDGSIVIIELF